MTETRHDSHVITDKLPSVYLDTSVPSYFAARPTRQMPMLRHQRITCLWWHAYRPRANVFVSPRVVAEAKQGDPEAARQRVELISSMVSLESSDEVPRLSKQILLEARLPASAESDAEHVAIAAFHKIEYLLTWNCKHLANRHILPKVRRVCERAGLRSPEICTPEDIIRRYANARRSN
jgi:hypothetical protein